MPHIPIPPKPNGFLAGVVSNTSGTININQPNSNVAQQIKDVAEQQARMVLDEWMKQYKDLFDSKERKLKIQNVHKLIGMDYDGRLKVMGIKEWDTYYEFTLDTNLFNQPETILLHRRQTDSGHYIMEYKSKTLWLNVDEIDSLDKIIVCMQTI
jgi:hypothetical protein